jgi:hypothetical protein
MCSSTFTNAPNASKTARGHLSRNLRRYSMSKIRGDKLSGGNVKHSQDFARRIGMQDAQMLTRLHNTVGSVSCSEQVNNQVGNIYVQKAPERRRISSVSFVSSGAGVSKFVLIRRRVPLSALSEFHTWRTQSHLPKTEK